MYYSFYFLLLDQFSTHTYLKEGGNNKVKSIEYPGLNHLFQESKTGDIMEYGEIEQTLSPQVLNDITNWIKEMQN
ncbi:MAG: hypothetical protein ACRCUJ_11310 [Phocaeicola sp.]